MVKSYYQKKELCNLKFIIANRDDTESLYVLNFGFEDVSKNAHWNKGARNSFFIHYVVSGKGFFNSNEINAGKGFLISPGEKCEYHSSSSEPWTYFWISFAGHDAENIAKKYVSPDENGIFEFDLSFEFLSLLDSVLAEITPVPVEKALGYFYFLISYNGKARTSFENRYVEAAKNYMSINISRPITVTELAAAVGINDRYLYNLFVKHEGVAPKQYLLNLKLSRASLMLRSSRITISEIAEHCGFPDVLAFSRFFSKREGMSPSKYRSTYLKNETTP